MHQLTTLARLNSQADEAHRILRAHNLGGTNQPVREPVVMPKDPQGTISRILAGARG